MFLFKGRKKRCPKGQTCPTTPTTSKKSSQKSIPSKGSKGSKGKDTKVQTPISSKNKSTKGQEKEKSDKKSHNPPEQGLKSTKVDENRHKKDETKKVPSLNKEKVPVPSDKINDQKDKDNNLSGSKSNSGIGKSKSVQSNAPHRHQSSVVVPAVNKPRNHHKNPRKSPPNSSKQIPSRNVDKKSVQTAGTQTKHVHFSDEDKPPRKPYYYTEYGQKRYHRRRHKSKFGLPTRSTTSTSANRGFGDQTGDKFVPPRRIVQPPRVKNGLEVLDQSQILVLRSSWIRAKSPLGPQAAKYEFGDHFEIISGPGRGKEGTKLFLLTEDMTSNSCTSTCCSIFCRSERPLKFKLIDFDGNILFNYTRPCSCACCLASCMGDLCCNVLNIYTPDCGLVGQIKQKCGLRPNFVIKNAKGKEIMKFSGVECGFCTCCRYCCNSSYKIYLLGKFANEQARKRSLELEEQNHRYGYGSHHSKNKNKHKKKRKFTKLKIGDIIPVKNLPQAFQIKDVEYGVSVLFPQSLNPEFKRLLLGALLLLNIIHYQKDPCCPIDLIF